MALRFICKYYVFVIIPFLIASCTLVDTDKLNSSKSILEKIIEIDKNSKEQKPIINITKEMVDYIEYPLIEVKSNGIIRQLLMIPLSTRNNTRYFSSGSGQSLSITGALVTKTKGINVELISVETEHNSPLIKNTLITKWPNKSSRTYMFSNPYFKTKSITFICERGKAVQEKIKISYKELILFKIKEQCKSNMINFINKYWINNSGEIKKSVQWVSPDNIYLDINVLK